MTPPGSTIAQVGEWAAPFLRKNAVEGGFRLYPLAGGANNRVFRVQTGLGMYVLKAYFQHPNDPRDRLGAEHGFYQLLVGARIGAHPQPVGWDLERRLALLEFVGGRKLSAGEITQNHLAQAMGFVARINQHRSRPEAERLAPASEACFSIADHLDCIDRRVEKLRRIESSAPVEKEAAEFVTMKLRPSWERLRGSIISQASHAPAGQKVCLQRAVRCLSPSDFGFHNTLLEPEGELRFFDFEYAGWDDPAKLICDFFCQPQVQVPLDWWERVEGSVAAWGGDGVGARARLLLPAYQIKWCCIMLNDFLSSDRLRREFAGAEVEARKATQLERARELHAHIQLT